MSFPQRTTTRSDGTHRKNEGQSRRKLSVNAPHQIYPKGRYGGGTTRCSLSGITRFSKLKPGGRRVAKRRGSGEGRPWLARSEQSCTACGLTAQPIGVPKRSRSRRRLDQGGIRDASGPNRGPYCPKSRRRDAGAGEAVTRPVAVIRRTTCEGHELDRKTEKRVPKSGTPIASGRSKAVVGSVRMRSPRSHRLASSAISQLRRDQFPAAEEVERLKLSVGIQAAEQTVRLAVRTGGEIKRVG